MQCGKGYWGGVGVSQEITRTFHILVECKSLCQTPIIFPSWDLRVINSLPMISSCVTQVKWKITLRSLICLCVYVDLRII